MECIQSLTAGQVLHRCCRTSARSSVDLLDQVWENAAERCLVGAAASRWAHQAAGATIARQRNPKKSPADGQLATSSTAAFARSAAAHASASAAAAVEERPFPALGVETLDAAVVATSAPSAYVSASGAHPNRLESLHLGDRLASIRSFERTILWRRGHQAHSTERFGQKGKDLDPCC